MPPSQASTTAQLKAQPPSPCQQERGPASSCWEEGGVSFQRSQAAELQRMPEGFYIAQTPPIHDAADMMPTHGSLH
jgi:hypothetical protein